MKKINLLIVLVYHFAITLFVVIPSVSFAQNEVDSINFAKRTAYQAVKWKIHGLGDSLAYEAKSFAYANLIERPDLPQFNTLTIGGKMWVYDSNTKRDTLVTINDQWKSMVINYIQGTICDPYHYTDVDFDNPKKVSVPEGVVCAYGFLGLGNQTESLGIEKAFYTKDKEIMSTVYSIYKNHSVHNSIFNWLKPSLKKSWILLGKEYKKAYREMIDYMIQYLSTFDLKKEDQYFKSLHVQGKDAEHSFLARDRFGKTSWYRKGSAWCYRRIKAEHMDKDYIMKWLNKIKKEIMVN
jgi:hypothetical protein